MSQLTDNIRFLRKQKGLTQSGLAESLGLNRSVIGSYEEGRAEPRISTLMDMANFFGISIDRLVDTDLSEVSEASVQGNPLPEAQGQGGKLKVLAITVDKEEKENIELVPQKAAAGYMNGFADPEYIEDLPRFQLPMLPQGTYRAFEISGDSMLPLASGTVVIGEYLDNWKDLREGETYVLVTGSEGVVYKRVFRSLNDPNSLTLHSDNSAYQPYDVSLNDVREAWKARAYLSMDFPDGELNLQRLAGIVMDLQQEVIRLKK